MSLDINEILRAAHVLDQKQIVYRKLREYLGLLIDDATPTDMLPYGVPKDIAQEVYEELGEQETACATNKQLLLEPAPPSRKSKTPKKAPGTKGKPKTRKKAEPKESAERGTGKKQASNG